MRVEGYEVTPEQISAALAFMDRMDGPMHLPFTRNDLFEHLTQVGVPCVGYTVAYRVADRIIQKERKAGHIEFIRGIGWVKKDK